MLPAKLAFVDLETTGGRATFDRIIEIGIIRVENNSVVQTFQSLVNPQAYLPPQIEYLTGITADMLTTAPVFEDVRDQICDLLDDCVFVAHNVRFDYGFLKNELRRCGVSFTSKQLCTVKLSRELFPQFPKHNLDSIKERFNFTCENRHRAFEDAHLLWQFYQKIQGMFETELLDAAYAKVTKKPSLPVYLSSEYLESLPERPGVYSFYGEGGVPLYIGKSTNLRDRVLSHFSSDHSSSKEMKIAQQIRSLEIDETPGELGALLLESQKIKQVAPLFNRQLRNLEKVTCLVKDESQEYTTVQIVQKDTILPAEFETILAVFRSKGQAETYVLDKAKEYKLCHKLLKLEHTKTSCFQYRLDNCKGACIQKEKPLFYNMRFLEAFNGSGIKQWPYKGAVALVEENQETQKVEVFVINQWCLLQRIRSDNNGDITSLLSEANDIQEVQFDLDTYKIIQKFIGKSRPDIHIIDLASVKGIPTLERGFFADSLLY